MAKRRVVFAGAYGIQNSGDDAPLLVMTEGLRRLNPEIDFEFTVLARHRDSVMEQATGARFIPNLEYQSREEAAGKWFRGFNFGDDPSDLAEVESAIREADLFVAGAGNFLLDIAFDLFRGPISLCASYAFLADVYRTPFMLYGITAGPIRSDRARRISAWIARRSSVATFRDEASAVLLDEIDPSIPIEVHPDPVLGLEPAPDALFERALKAERWTRKGDRPRLAVAWRDLDFLNFDEEIIIKALGDLSREYDLLFIPQGTGRDCNDREIARGIIAQLPGANIHSLEERHLPSVLMRFYETVDVTLAARLHGAVFSARSGTPVAGLAYLPKVRSFLEGVGLGTHCVGIEEATAGSIKAAVRSAHQVDRSLLHSRVAGLSRGVDAYLAHATRLLGLQRASCEDVRVAGASVRTL